MISNEGLTSGRAKFHSPLATTLARGALTSLLAWSARRRQRHALVELDDRLLRDVGLTRHQVRIETRKPFWHE